MIIFIWICLLFWNDVSSDEKLAVEREEARDDKSSERCYRYMSRAGIPPATMVTAPTPPVQPSATNYDKNIPNSSPPLPPRLNRANSFKSTATLDPNSLVEVLKEIVTTVHANKHQQQCKSCAASKSRSPSSSGVNMRYGTVDVYDQNRKLVKQIPRN